MILIHINPTFKKSYFFRSETIRPFKNGLPAIRSNAIAIKPPG